MVKLWAPVGWTGSATMPGVNKFWYVPLRYSPQRVRAVNLSYEAPFTVLWIHQFSEICSPGRTAPPSRGFVDAARVKVWTVSCSVYVPPRGAETVTFQ